MAEGWGDDEINSGIAHLQSRHAVPERSSAASALPRRGRTCPQEVGKPACLVVCRFGPDPPGFSRHLRKQGDKNCPKCAYARNRRTWKLATRMPALRHSWLKAKPVASTSWGVGCRACRWYCRSGIPGTSVLGKANPFVHMQVGAAASKYPTCTGTPAQKFTGWRRRLCRMVTPQDLSQHLLPVNSRSFWSDCARVV